MLRPLSGLQAGQGVNAVRHSDPADHNTQRLFSQNVCWTFIKSGNLWFSFWFEGF